VAIQGIDYKYFKQRILPGFLPTDMRYPVGKTRGGLTAYILGYTLIADYWDAIFFLAPLDKKLMDLKISEAFQKYPVCELHRFPDMELLSWDDSSARRSMGGRLTA